MATESSKQTINACSCRVSENTAATVKLGEISAERIAWNSNPACHSFEPMNDAHAKLAVALRERLSVIADRLFAERDPAAHLAALRAVSEKIAHLEKELPAQTDPRLRHFLERCSYDKALALLETDRGR